MSGRWCPDGDTDDVWAISEDNVWSNSVKGELLCPDDYLNWGVQLAKFRKKGHSSVFNASSIPVGTVCKYKVEVSENSNLTKAYIEISKSEILNSYYIWIK